MSLRTKVIRKQTYVIVEKTFNENEDICAGCSFLKYEYETKKCILSQRCELDYSEESGVAEIYKKQLSWVIKNL